VSQIPTPHLDKIVALAQTRGYERVEHGRVQRVGGYESTREGENFMGGKMAPVYRPLGRFQFAAKRADAHVTDLRFASRGQKQQHLQDVHGHPHGLLVHLSDEELDRLHEGVHNRRNR
jgi:hypothetical protein